MRLCLMSVAFCALLALRCDERGPVALFWKSCALISQDCASKLIGPHLMNAKGE